MPEFFSRTTREKAAVFLPYLHIFVLAGFSLAQPLFDLLSRNAEFFVVHYAQPIDIFLLTVLLSALVPLLAIGFELLVKTLTPRAQGMLHLFLVGFFAALFALHTLRNLRIGALMIVAVTIGTGVLFGLSYRQFQRVRAALTLLIPSILLFPAFFLLDSRVSKLVFPGEEKPGVTIQIVSRTPVVVVVFDEFPTISLLDAQRRIDPIRYPNLHSLAGESYWFRNATTINTGTLISVPAILDGLYPSLDAGHLPIRSDHPNNLFTLLSGSHQLRVFENMTRLSPLSTAGPDLSQRIRSITSDCAIIYLHLLLPQDLASKHLPRITANWKNFAGANAEATDTRSRFRHFQGDWTERHLKFQRFVDSIGRTQGPALYFFHSLLPHATWNYFPSGKRYIVMRNAGMKTDEKHWAEDEWLVIQAYHRHLLQVEFVDRLVGKLVARLKEAGLYDKTLIVITSDHGASFSPGDSRRDATLTNYPDILLVPLIIKTPFQRRGVVSERNVEIVDILPTIADILQIDLPWPVDGHSVLDLTRPERSEKRIYVSDKGWISFDPRLPAQQASLERKLAFFGSGPVDQLFQVGPHGKLVGRETTEVGIGKLADWVVELDRKEFFRNVDLDRSVIQANITGRIRNHTDHSGPVHLAVSVNGVIRAVTRTASGTGAEDFSALVPEDSFRNGSNDVSIYRIRESTKGITLEPLLEQTLNKF